VTLHRTYGRYFAGSGRLRQVGPGRACGSNAWEERSLVQCMDAQYMKPWEASYQGNQQRRQFARSPYLVRIRIIRPMIPVLRLSRRDKEDYWLGANFTNCYYIIDYR